MNIVASIYARKVRHFIGTTYNAEERALVDTPKAEYLAGSLIGYVIEEGDLLYFLNDEKTKRYGKGEYVSHALKDRTRAIIAARRHFGPDVIVA